MKVITSLGYDNTLISSEYNNSSFYKIIFKKLNYYKQKKYELISDEYQKEKIFQ